LEPSFYLIATSHSLHLKNFKVMKVVKSILLVLLVIFVALLGFSLLAPKTYSIEESIKIGAPYALVVEQTTHWPNFQEWSPWSEMDPDMELSYEGDFGKVGSRYTWKGNEDAGSGSQEITAVSHDRVDIDLHFKEPFESLAKTYYLFNLEGDSMTVAWGMSGEMAWPWNVMTHFLKGSITKDYQKGLQSLKERCESIAADHVVDGFWIREIVLENRTYIGRKKLVKWAEMQEFYSAVLGAAFQAILKSGIEPVGAPSGIYYEWDTVNMQANMMAAIPCPVGTLISGFDSYSIGGKGYYINYYGQYEGLGNAHEAMEKYMIKNNISPNAVAIEEYVTDPETEEDPGHWLTKIMYIGLE